MAYVILISPTRIHLLTVTGVLLPPHLQEMDADLLAWTLQMSNMVAIKRKYSEVIKFWAKSVNFFCMSDICVLKMDETAVLTGAMRRSLVLVMDKDVAGHHIGKVCIFCHVFAFKIGRCALNFTRNVGAGDFSRLDREYVVY